MKKGESNYMRGIQRNRGNNVLTFRDCRKGLAHHMVGGEEGREQTGEIQLSKGKVKVNTCSLAKPDY